MSEILVTYERLGFSYNACRGYTMRRYKKFLARLSIAVVLIAVVSWAVIQKPVEPQEPDLAQGAQTPLYIPSAGST